MIRFFSILPIASLLIFCPITSDIDDMDSIIIRDHAAQKIIRCQIDSIDKTYIQCKDSLLDAIYKNSSLSL